MSTIQIGLIIISSIVFFGRLFFGFFKRFSPFNHKSLSLNQNDLTDDNFNNLDINKNKSNKNDINQDKESSVEPSVSDYANAHDKYLKPCPIFKSRMNSVITICYIYFFKFILKITT